MNLYTQAESNIRKTWFYLFLFLILTIGVGWVISWYLDSSVILYLAVILAVSMNFSAYWFSDKIILSMSRARPIEKRDNPELYRLVENLCITVGLPLPKIYIIELYFCIFCFIIPFLINIVKNFLIILKE